MGLAETAWLLYTNNCKTNNIIHVMAVLSYMLLGYLVNISSSMDPLKLPTDKWSTTKVVDHCPIHWKQLLVKHLQQLVWLHIFVTN